MSKKTLIIILAVTLVLMIATGIGAYTAVSSRVNSKIDESVQKQENLQDKISKTREDLDTNGHLPSDVVKFFVNDVKFGDTAKAKLYLTFENQSLELEKALDLDVPLDELTIKEVSYESRDEGMLVKLSYSTSSDSINSVKYFNVLKVDSAWKINEIREG